MSNHFRGIDVAFAVKYFNVSEPFLPFDEFVVSLLHSDEVHTFSRKVIGQTKAEFRPCANLTSDNKKENQQLTSASSDCFNNILNGKYTTRVRNKFKLNEIFNYKQTVAALRLILSIRDAISQLKLSCLVNIRAGGT